jgi:decaprenylphospho-beta-D-erythro-pentofuranosid-2-ulose 2-reductase
LTTRPFAGSTALILGGSSDIGRAIAGALAAGGASVILAGRDAARLEPDAQDLRLRHQVDARVAEFDVLATDRHEGFLDGLPLEPDIVVCVVGLLGDQAESAANPGAAKLVMETNYVAPCLLLGVVARRMAAAGRGTIVGISSVAGERGRASNYVYGSAKAGFTAFLSGLRASLSRTPVRVVTVKPGFVATRMTAGMKLNPVLTAQPAEVGAAVQRAIASGHDVIYVRSLWRPVMAIVRAIPERVFKRLRF